MGERINYKKFKNDTIISKNRDFFELVEMIAMAFIVVILIFTFLFRIVGVKGSSMEYTLQDSNRLILSSISYKPHKGDIVVLGLGEIFSDPIIKRVIATEGQEVNIDDEGNVYIDGEKIKEDYIHDKTIKKDYLNYPFVVPKDNIFVMGDNRMNSTDGRNFGCVDKKYVIGKAIFRIFPFNEIGKI